MKKILTAIMITILTSLIISHFVSTAYGQETDNTGNQTIPVTSANESTAPKAEFYGKAIGGVTPGDLFYIDSTASPIDISVTIGITNTNVLIHHLRYLTLQVTVYTKDSNGKWVKPQIRDGQAADAYLTLQNGNVNFSLPGGTHYKVTVNSGCYNCYSTGQNVENFAPTFYCDAVPE